MLSLIAQTMPNIPGGIAGIAVGVILTVAICAIVAVATKAMGKPIPPWAWKVFTIVIIALVCIFAIKSFLTG